jgi:hypothetical protein
MNLPTPAERRELARKARDAFPPMGVYAVRDRVTGAVRVAASRNVHSAINRALFELRQGVHRDAAMQAAWKRDGAERFGFEVLELVKERSEAGFDYGAELKELEALHRAMLEAP